MDRFDFATKHVHLCIQSHNFLQGDARKAAVVGKQTTAVYAESGRSPLFKCVGAYHCRKSRSRSAKKQRLDAVAPSHQPSCQI